MTSLLNTNGVECAICEKDSADVTHFLCAGCARSSAYLARLEHARVLLEKQSLHDVIINLTSSESSEEGRGDDQDQKIWAAELLQLKLNETKKSVDQTRHKIGEVKQDVHDLKADVSQLKAQVEKRKQSLAVVNDVPRPEHQDKSSKITSSLAHLQSKAIVNRAVLCREAASLMRLRQRRRQAGTNGREQYSIAGLTLPDLREISNVRCTDLSAVLSSVAHLTILTAFYLGIRLPAEILLPNSQHPYPMICTPNTSYRGEKAVDMWSAHSSPSASRHDMKVSAKARPLFVASENRDERLYAYQKDHSQGFNLLVEGIALLAWDIAWLSRSQGFASGTNDWVGICNIGKNLHQLIVANTQAPSMARLQEPTTLKRTISSQRERRKELPGRLGQNSDIYAALTNIRTPRNELITDWAFLSWQAVATSLRKVLLTEIASAEWELLQDDEWDETAGFVIIR